MSILSANPLQHWLDTPIGAYEGYPTYGNMIPELLYKNKQELQGASALIMAKIKNDLGIEIASTISNIIIFQDEIYDDIFYIVLFQNNNQTAIGEYNVA
ncbi:MAG: hypothetical protein ACWGHH_06470 [Sulfurovaceae bacterium]